MLYKLSMRTGLIILLALITRLLLLVSDSGIKAMNQSTPSLNRLNHWQGIKRNNLYLSNSNALEEPSQRLAASMVAFKLHD